MKTIRQGALALAILTVPFLCNGAEPNIVRVQAPVTYVTHEQWVSVEALFSEWKNVGDLHECESMSPVASTVSSNYIFTQAYSSCKQKQARTIQPQVINELTGEVKANGSITTEERTLSGLSGTRSVQGINTSGVLSLSSSMGVQSGLGAGYYRQINGGYHMGNSQQKTPNGYQTLLAAIYYNNAYTIQYLVITGTGVHAQEVPKEDMTYLKPYSEPYSGVRLLDSSGNIIASYKFDYRVERRNWVGKSVVIDKPIFDFLTGNITRVARVQLFE